MDYNPYDAFICETLEADALELIQDLLSQKLEHFRSLDKDEKKALLDKSPNYTHEVHYTEKIKLDEFRKVTLESWFQNLADQYQLREKKGRQLLVKDIAIVNHFATKWNSYLKDQYKGKIKCEWAVTECNGRPVFMKPERALEIVVGGSTAQDRLAEKRAKAGKPQVEPEEKSVAKLEKEIAQLKADNAKRATMQVTNHAPLILPSSPVIAPPLSANGNSTVQ